MGRNKSVNIQIMKNLIAIVCEETSNRKIIDMVFKSGSVDAIEALCNALPTEDVFFAFYRRSGRSGFEIIVERMADFHGYWTEYVEFRLERHNLYYWRQMEGAASLERITKLAKSHSLPVKYRGYR